ncbi:MAG: cellulase family glycosylhydrolase [Proteobacteria bacterium]|nr:cellulase family glycosylhydrolase [Pseudomonadota bacterium]
MVDGNIVGPDGKPFFARGLNIFDWQSSRASDILISFPGLNFVRFAVYNYATPDAYAPFIKTMTDAHVVVELEDHTDSTGMNTGGSRGEAFTGDHLTAELNWYADAARAYASNPYVWFGTNNEPPKEGLTAWQKATYDAIRDTGNVNPILIEMPGGGWPGLDFRGYGLDDTVYRTMTNIVGDVHYYGWESGFSTDQDAVNQVLSSLIQDTKTLQSGSGTLPVILGEYGPSTDGTSMDPNSAQSIRAAQQSTETAGAIAFAWHTEADSLADDAGNLTEFGQAVARYIAQGTPMAAPGMTTDRDGEAGGGMAGFGVTDTAMHFVAPADATAATGSGDAAGAGTAAAPSDEFALAAQVAASPGGPASDFAAAAPVVPLPDDAADPGAASAVLPLSQVPVVLPVDRLSDG